MASDSFVDQAEDRAVEALRYAVEHPDVEGGVNLREAVRAICDYALARLPTPPAEPAPAPDPEAHCPTDGCPPYGGQKVNDSGACEHCGHEVPQPDPDPVEGDRAAEGRRLLDKINAAILEVAHSGSIASRAGLWSHIYEWEEHMNRARVQPRRVSDWRPIETAPKDGTQILAWVQSYFQGRGGVVVALWQDNSFWDGRAWKVQPTHWMPLPTETPEINPDNKEQ